MHFTRHMAEEYIELDWKGRGRFTHYPSGDTCIRHDYMVSSSQGDMEWSLKVRDFFAKHPQATAIISGTGKIIDNTANIPMAGGDLSVGDIVILGSSDDPETHIIVERNDVLRTFDRQADDPGYTLTLDDGNTLFWDNASFGWFCRDMNSPSTVARARKAFVWENLPQLDGSVQSLSR